MNGEWGKAIVSDLETIGKRWSRVTVGVHLKEGMGVSIDLGQSPGEGGLLKIQARAVILNTSVYTHALKLYLPLRHSLARN